jgi:hypothetical protein
MMRRFVAIVSVVGALLPVCGSSPDEGPSLSPRCRQAVAAYDNAKAANAANPSKHAKAALVRAQEALFNSGCLHS